jgi:N-acyl homoserine lactone hydrolase
LHLLSDGYFTLDKSFLVYMKYMGQPYEAALKALLILTPERKILVDTGIGTLPEKYRKFYIVKRKNEEDLKFQIVQHGLKPEDIDTVINTHLHFDHCGNNKLFPKAKFVIQASEFKYALAPERFQKNAYIKELFDFEANYELAKGEHKVTDEVFVVPTPGHSIGNQSVIAQADGKNYVYCGDAAPIKENLERRNVPGVLYSAHDALQSIDRLRTISDAFYIYSHDNEQPVV